MSADPVAPPATALFVARASFGVLLVTFVALLGGLHPSNRKRDIIVGVIAAIVVAMNAPIAVWIARNVRVPERRRAAILAAVALVIRLAFAAWVLRFIASITHERPD